MAANIIRRSSEVAKHIYVAYGAVHLWSPSEFSEAFAKAKRDTIDNNLVSLNKNKLADPPSSSSSPSSSSPSHSPSKQNKPEHERVRSQRSALYRMAALWRHQMPSMVITGILKHDHTIAKDPEHKPEVLGEHWAPIFTQKQSNEAMILDFVNHYVMRWDLSNIPPPMKVTMLRPSTLFRIVVWGQMASLIQHGTPRVVLLRYVCSVRN